MSDANQSVITSNEENRRFQQLKEEWQRIKNLRGGLDPMLDELIYYVRQSTYAENGVADFQINQDKNEIFDPTAPWAAVQSANGLGSYLTPPNERWMKLGVMGRPTHTLSKASRLYLEAAEDRIFYELSLPEVGFGSATSELNLDIVTLGTSVMFEDWNRDEGHVRFIPYNIKNCSIAENNDRKVDTVFREVEVTIRQLLQYFPDFADYNVIKVKESTDKVTLVHGVFPNKDRDKFKFGKMHLPFSSVYFSPDLELVFKEGGYKTFPYMVPRWMRVTGDPYGQSMAMHCLSAIRNANQIVEELHVSQRMANWPPMAYDDDSILLPPGRVSPEFYPGSLAPMIPGTERPTPIHAGAQPQGMFELLQMQQKWITDAFMVSHLLRERKKERQSVTEILDERSEMLRQLGSTLGRMEGEWLGPMVGRTFGLLRDNGEIPTPPEELSKDGLDIVFTNPAAKAQLGSKAQNMTAFIQDLSVAAQAMPEIMQTLKPAEWAQELATLRDVTPKVINTPEEMQAMQQAQAEQAQQAQMLDSAPGLAKATKDIADARQTDPSVAGLLG